MPTTNAEILRALFALLDKVAPYRHSIDFASVVWHGTNYAFTGGQARVVALLWEAHMNNTPSIRQETLLEAAGSVCNRLASLFKGSPAWGTLIVPGAVRGTFRLAAPTT